MNIFESLEELNISEECFEDIINIVEEYINELKDKTVMSAFNKRYDQYKDAAMKARQNTSTENLRNYVKKASKLDNHIELGTKRDKRLGKNVYKDVNRETRVAKTKEARKNYHNKLDNYDYVRKNASAWGNKPYGIEDVENAEAEARAAKKNYHNTMDAYNTVNIHRDKNGLGDTEYLKKHLEYQRTHDSKGNRIR